MLKGVLKRRRLLIVLFLILLLIIGYIILRPRNSTILYNTVVATKGSVTVNVSASGSVNIGNIENANFRVSGYLSEIDVRVGDPIKSGQILAKLNPDNYQNIVNQDQSSLNQANNNLNLKYQQSYTFYDIQNAKEAINIAQSKINNDNDNLLATTLKSNINGIVTAINNNVGDSLTGSGINSNSNSLSSTSTSSSPFITIVDPNSLYVSITVGETDAQKIKPGQLAEVSFDALGEKKYVGKVDSISYIPTVSSNVVSFNVKILLNKLDSDVKPNLTSNATILIETHDNVITVPNSAIKTISNQKTVQILRDSKKIPETVSITTGISNDTTTEITQGLSEVDVVVTGVQNAQTTSSTTGGGLGGLFGGGRAGTAGARGG